MKTIGRILLWAFAVLGGLTALGVAGVVALAISFGPDAGTPERFNLWVDLNRGVMDGASTSPVDSLLFGQQTLMGDAVLAIDAAAHDDRVAGLMVEVGAGASLGRVLLGPGGAPLGMAVGLAIALGLTARAGGSRSR